MKKIGLKRIGYDICEYILACCLIINCRAIWLTIPGSGDKINSIVEFDILKGIGIISVIAGHVAQNYDIPRIMQIQ